MIGEQIKLFAGSATHDLAQHVADHLGLPLALGSVTQFPDGESRVLIEESVRGCDCYIIQSTCAPVNHNIMELLVFIDALRRASAWRINAVIPYFGYARQDKKVQAREPITAKLVANMLEKAGIHRVITVDLHAGQIQGFFDVPVDHLTALDILGGYLKKTDLSSSVVVSPDVGRATEGRRLANHLGVD
jgi:ribose-phosphate pyrophosphokinase